MASIITTGTVTVDLTINDTTARFPVGNVVQVSDGGKAMYVTATKTINQYDAVIIINTASAAGASIGCVPASTGVAATSPRLAFAQTAMAINTYGWVMLESNNIRVNVAASAQPAVPLFTTATAGVLDVTTVSAGYCAGVIAMSSAASASAVPCVAGPCIVIQGI